MSYKRIQFGYYSQNCKNVVAIGSKFDESLLIDMSLNKANPIHDVTTTSLIEEEFSSLWHGEKSITVFQLKRMGLSLLRLSLALIKVKYIKSYGKEQWTPF